MASEQPEPSTTDLFTALNLPVTRRQALQGLIGWGAGAAFVLSGSHASYTAASSPSPSSMPIAYPAATSAQHQQHVATLAKHGYRMISLSVYGDPTDARYAAIWIQAPGPNWVARQDMTDSQFQAFSDAQSALGYVPSLVAATGSASNAIFAAVFEQQSSDGRIMQRGLTNGSADDPASLLGAADLARKKKLILKEAVIYGTPADRLYAAIWVPNDRLVQWDWRLNDTQEGFETWGPAFASLPYRPDFLTVTADNEYLYLYKNDSVGQTTVFHDLTAEAYHQTLSDQAALGLTPTRLQGSGIGDAARYAAIFAAQTVPTQRQWTANGEVSLQSDGFDVAMKSFMQANGVRAGSLAVSQNGAMVIDRAYTWAEPDYPVIQTSSLFRISGCTSLFTKAAVYYLAQAGQLDLTAAVFPMLNITAGPGQKPDPRLNDITVDDLVTRTGGWDKATAPNPFQSGSLGFDPIFWLRSIAQSLGLSHAPTTLEVAQYMAGQPLQSDPGSTAVWCNFGNLLLGLVIEKVTGQSYIDYLQQSILAPLGITDVHAGSTEKSGRLAREVTYDANGVGDSPLYPTNAVLVPDAYGGSGLLLEAAPATCGLVATASSVVQFIHRYKPGGFGLRPPPGNWDWESTGIMDGTSSLAHSRGIDGIDYAYVFNSRDFPFVPDALETLNASLKTLCDEMS